MLIQKGLAQNLSLKFGRKNYYSMKNLSRDSYHEDDMEQIHQSSNNLLGYTIAFNGKVTFDSLLAYYFKRSPIIINFLQNMIFIIIKILKI